MSTIGFSTGAVAKSDVARALCIVEDYEADAIEYSALRFHEFEPVVEFLLSSGVGNYRFAAFHAPSQFESHQERDVVRLLAVLVDHLDISIVVHPDTICDVSLWLSFGNKLCIENMDHRKNTGRTSDELAQIFSRLPDARLCFDIGHAHAIDRSMSIAYGILSRFRNRLAHIHASEVTDEGMHRGFSTSSHCAFLKLADFFSDTIPIILETQVPEAQLGKQLSEARCIFMDECDDVIDSLATGHEMLASSCSGMHQEKDELGVDTPRTLKPI